MPPKRVIKKKTTKKTKLEEYKILQSGKKGSVRYYEYAIKDYKHTGKRTNKVLKNIEEFTKIKTLGMGKIDILKDATIWATIKFDDGSYVSTTTEQAGQYLDFDTYQDYIDQGKSKKIKSFSFQFIV
jgi:hypothetical protein